MKDLKAMYEAIEREVRLQVLRNQVSELQSAIAKLEGERPTPSLKERTKAAPARKGKKSLRALTIEILKRAKKPLHLDEILRRVEKAGYRSQAKSPRLILYNLLSLNKKDFRRVAESTFEVVRPEK